MANVCEFIDEWKASEIWGSYNSAPKFFKEINHIQFCNLTNLCVSDSEIESIESIHRIQFPKLNTLYLCTFWIELS